MEHHSEAQLARKLAPSDILNTPQAAGLHERQPLWMGQAACKGSTELFYSEDKACETEAVAICMQCPVKIACEEFVFEIKDQYGTWAGTTQSERRLMLSAMRKKKGAA